MSQLTNFWASAILNDRWQPELVAVRRSTDCAPAGRLWDEADHITKMTIVRRVVKSRRMRREYLGEGLFFDPAWDLLLEMFASALMDQRYSVSGVIGGAEVPMTTGLRWLDVLIGRGLAVRVQDPLDGRRVFVELSPEGEGLMNDYFRELPPRTLPL